MRTWNQRRQRLLTMGFLAVAAPVLAGCSQIASLTPVAGDQIARAGIATTDVLDAKGVTILVVPVCEGKKPEFVCKGTTVSGQEIVSETSGADGDGLTVTVNGKEIFSGKVSEVITEAGRTS